MWIVQEYRRGLQDLQGLRVSEESWDRKVTRETRVFSVNPTDPQEVLAPRVPKDSWVFQAQQAARETRVILVHVDLQEHLVLGELQA